MIALPITAASTATLRIPSGCPTSPDWPSTATAAIVTSDATTPKMADIFKPTHIPSMGFPSPTSAKARAKKRSSSAELGLLTTSSLNSHNLSLCGFSPILTKLQERNWALQPLKDLRGQHDGFFFATSTDSIQRYLNPNAIHQMHRC